LRRNQSRWLENGFATALAALALANDTRRLDVHDQTELDVDQIVAGVGDPVLASRLSTGPLDRMAK
jgi:hypothetical protein